MPGDRFAGHLVGARAGPRRHGPRLPRHPRGRRRGGGAEAAAARAGRRGPLPAPVRARVAAGGVAVAPPPGAGAGRGRARRRAVDRHGAGRRPRPGRGADRAGHDPPGQRGPDRGPGRRRPGRRRARGPGAPGRQAGQRVRGRPRRRPARLPGRLRPDQGHRLAERADGHRQVPGHRGLRGAPSRPRARTWARPPTSTSSGGLLYRALAGSQPFPRPRQIATVMAHIKDPPPRPSEANPACPPALDRRGGHGHGQEAGEALPDGVRWAPRPLRRRAAPVARRVRRQPDQEEMPYLEGFVAAVRPPTRTSTSSTPRRRSSTSRARRHAGGRRLGRRRARAR